MVRRMGLWLVVLCLGLIISPISSAQAATLNVPLESSTIQSAIDAAVAGDTVLVADGTYVENIDFLGKAITVQSVNGADTTTIDGNASGNVVRFTSGEGADSVLDGFTIQNGSAGSGGGIFCNYSSSPTITNCIIRNNSTDVGYGGGISCHNYSSPTITNCTISSNTGNYYGGGISCHWYSSPTITNCTISSNTSSWGGSGINCIFDSSPTITNCTIRGNTGRHGGGLFCWYSSSPTVTNCTITGNKVTMYGGGLRSDGSSPTITNCTISSNTAGVGGGIWAIGQPDSPFSPIVINSILWGDTAGGRPNEIHLISTGYTFIDITYSDIQGGWTGEGNIDADPLFVDPVNGDYHLTQNSPCIDVGNNDAPNLYYIDFESDPRIIDGNIDGTATVDMGVDEFVPISAEVDITHDIIDVTKQAPNIKCYIELPDGNAGDIDLSTVLLQSPEGSVLALQGFWELGDRDADGIADLKVKFDRPSVNNILTQDGETTLTVSGNLNDGTPFAGSDVVTVIGNGQ